MFYRQTCALLWALSFACGQICDYILSLDYDTDLGDKNMHRIFPQRPLLYQILTETQFPSPLKPGYHSKHFKKLPEVA